MLTGVGVGQQASTSVSTASGSLLQLLIFDILLQAATPLSAVFQFFLRDLSGMLGGVTFAFLQARHYTELSSGLQLAPGCKRDINSVCFLQGSKLDIYAKQWRLFADCLNNVGQSPVIIMARLCQPCIAFRLTFAGKCRIGHGACLSSLPLSLPDTSLPRQHCSCNNK